MSLLCLCAFVTLNKRLLTYLLTYHSNSVGDVACQFGGAAARRNGWTVRTEDVSSAAHIEAGSLPSGSSLSAVRYAQDDGQRGHVLRAPRAFHIHLQVFNAFHRRSQDFLWGALFSFF